ncbi:M24 family metallopeptidase [Mesorhizobium australicum]|uniref:Xaa-Pro aminopeptidase n=1 Tax=Mesorhizobium australicum TaxID=536018 RepID=A0A1X7MX62_9HYPH|nr:Xaa-Pro peptidase family protein [Mesorhizobium australicum]SMH29485.1 Xaa-Pro aminopeptidase [Mesorhizobium australicum]
MLQTGTSLATQITNLAVERLDRVRRKMEAEGQDLLVVASPENVLYTSGYESMGATINRRYSYAALVTLDDLLLVAPAADFAPAIDAGIRPEKVYTFGKFFFSGGTAASHNEVRHDTFEDGLLAALSGLKAERIAAEHTFLSKGALDALTTAGATVADATSWMLALRSRKLPLEVELLRYTTQITQRAIEAGIAGAAPGVTDKEVASIVASHMSLGGGLPRNVTVVGGLRSALADAMSTERPLAAGDLLRFDTGCSYYGYKSDMARTAVIGEPTRLQAERYAALLEGLQAAIDMMKPGVNARDVFEKSVTVVEAKGLRPYRRQHVGHAIGMAVYEAPVIMPESGDILQAGATFCLETPYYEPGWGGMMVEDTGLLTDDGFELFSTTDRSLRVVPA